MKILKIVLIVIFALALTVSGGLLCYSAIKGPLASQGGGNKNAGDAPDATLFETTKEHQKDLSVIEGSSTMDPAEKVATMLVNATFNHIWIDQYYFFSRVDVEGENGDYSFSEYDQSFYQMNTFRRVQAYTGKINTFKIQADFVNQRLTSMGTCDYDFDEKTWLYTIGNPSSSPKTISRSEVDREVKETYYRIYSLFDFPIDLGGWDSLNDKNEGRVEELDYSLIDSSSVSITEKDGYYILKFNADIDGINRSGESMDRFSDSTSGGRMSNMTFKTFSVTAEIWKDAGVFRSLNYEVTVNAKINGKRGDAVIEKTMNFSYDDETCCVAKGIKSVPSFYNKLSTENQAECDKMIAEMEEKTAKTKK